MSLRAIILAAGMVGLGFTAAAQEPALARQSPFGGAAGGGNQVPTAPELELRGIMSAPEGVQYCIYDPARKSSVWASVNDSGNAFLVKSGNPAMDEVTIEAEGRIVTLRMRTGKVIPERVEQPEAQLAAPVVARRQPGEPRAPREKPGQ